MQNWRFQGYRALHIMQPKCLKILRCFLKTALLERYEYLLLLKRHHLFKNSTQISLQI